MKRTAVVVALLLPFVNSAQSTGQIEINAPYVTTPESIVGAMLKLAQVSKDDLVYDLGCGDGRIVIEAAKRFGARGVGIDINPERISEARANARVAGVARLLKFETGDVLEADFHSATVVMLYLLPSLNLRLRPKLLKELRPDTRVISHEFNMGDWVPEKTEVVDGGKIFLWRIPATPER